jgi:NAD(P)-dependent dehydrogenase (short-subunit alcohol dehydrogenase family)
MATDWARHGLQCNAIAPGYFDTPLNAALVADASFNAWLESARLLGGGARSKNWLARASFWRPTHLHSSTDTFSTSTEALPPRSNQNFIAWKAMLSDR